MNNNEILNDSVVRIKIVGVGGGGSNAVERMIDADIPMVEYITINTDDGGYKRSSAKTKLQIGKREAKGKGAGGIPEKGLRSAEENRKEIEEALKGCEMVFITAGMGGGTGTGAAPVVAEIARKLGILTVAVVTKPFAFEGKIRMNNAIDGITKLEKHADSIIVISNENLKSVSQTKITLRNALDIADDVLVQTVKNLVEVIQSPALINSDFADITSVVRQSGYMHTATGQASGADRVEKIVPQLITNKLLSSSVKDTTAMLLCINAPMNVSLDEVDKITSALSDEASPDCNIIFGMNFDETLGDKMKVLLIATAKKV